MLKIKKNIEYVYFCKYSKQIMNVKDPNKDTKKLEENSQFSESKSVYVREDDQDWGSSGMNDIQKESD